LANSDIVKKLCDNITGVKQSFATPSMKVKQQLKTFLRKAPKSQIDSFKKTAVKVFKLHMKHWIKQNVDAKIYPLDTCSMLDFLRAC